MRTLGIDWGSKRIGIAISDPLNISALPLPYIANDLNFFQKLKDIMIEKDVCKILVGNPKSLNGSASRKCEEVAQFVNLLKENVNCEIILRDERFSTSASEKTLINAGVKRNKRKEVIDSMAAVFVLQGYLDSL